MMSNEEIQRINYRKLKSPSKESKLHSIEKDFFSRPKLKEVSLVDKLIKAIFITGLLITFYTLALRMEYKWDQVDLALGRKLLVNMFNFSAVETAMKMSMVKSLINTMALGFVSTFTGFICGIVLALFAARNISNNGLSTGIRSFAGLVRAVPTIIWVLIFVSGYGLSATTAVIGMFFHTLAFFIRALAESFEEVDEATIEALLATGANKIQVIFGAILPSSVSKIISWFALRFEQNFGTAVIIGPAVGVPGTIGTMINNASRMGDYSALGFGIFLIFVTAFVMETAMNKVRQKNIIS
ncbi:MAG: ABC transporter permease subunit [Bacillota bacterium]|nr:ABC transporter permease subunit [Bacillota bacterium]